MSDSPETTVDAAVLVAGRGVARTIKQLGMACSDVEIPLFLSDKAAALGTWLGMGRFSGEAPTIDREGALGSSKMVELHGTVAVSVTGLRLIGILSPDSAGEPAVWVSMPRSQLSFTTRGSEGLFKKRPQQLVMATQAWRLDMTEVAKLLPNMNRIKTGEIGSLMAALHVS